MAVSSAAIKLNENGIPDFDALPFRKGDPKYSAWGLYGDEDELGTLNRLTDEQVAKAAKNEIKAGLRCDSFFNLFIHSFGLIIYV